MSAYTQLKTAIEGILPATWKLDAFEKPEGSPLPDVTAVEMKIRTVTRLPANPLGSYQIDWVVTVTSPHTSRETADPQLFDDLIAFLFALDTTEGLKWLGWTEATKTVGADLDRLAYDITIRTHTSKAEA